METKNYGERKYTEEEYQIITKHFNTSEYEKWIWYTLTSIVPGDKVSIKTKGSMGEKNFSSRCTEHNGVNTIVVKKDNKEVIKIYYFTDGSNEIIKEVA